MSIVVGRGGSSFRLEEKKTKIKEKCCEKKGEEEELEKEEVGRNKVFYF